MCATSLDTPTVEYAVKWIIDQKFTRLELIFDLTEARSSEWGTEGSHLSVNPPVKFSAVILYKFKIVCFKLFQSPSLLSTKCISHYSLLNSITAVTWTTVHTGCTTVHCTEVFECEVQYFIHFITSILHNWPLVLCNILQCIDHHKQWRNHQG